MTDLENRLRDAFEAAAATVTEESLAPPEPPSRLDRASASPGGQSVGRRRWAPAAAAAAVAAVIGVVSLIHGQSDTLLDPGTTPTSKAPRSGQPTGGCGLAELGCLPSRPWVAEQGRHFDVGRLTGSSLQPHGALVIYLRRVQVAGTTDRQIAEHGFTPYAHTDQIEQGLGRVTYRIPVLADATFTVNLCKGWGAAPTRLVPHRVSAATFLRSLPVKYGAVVVRLDPLGRLVSVQTDGGC